MDPFTIAILVGLGVVAFGSRKVDVAPPAPRAPTISAEPIPDDPNATLALLKSIPVLGELASGLEDAADVVGKLIGGGPASTAQTLIIVKPYLDAGTGDELARKWEAAAEGKPSFFIPLSLKASGTKGDIEVLIGKRAAFLTSTPKATFPVETLPVIRELIIARLVVLNTPSALQTISGEFDRERTLLTLVRAMLDRGFDSDAILSATSEQGFSRDETLTAIAKEQPQ